VTVTLTVTATYGAGTDTHTFPIKVGIIPLSTVAEVIAVANTTIIRVHGVVTSGEYYHTYMIQDATGRVAVYTSNATILAFLAANIGKEVEVIGSKTTYSGLVEIAPTEATLVGDGTVPAAVSLDAVTLDNTNLLPFQGQLVSLTNMLVSDVYVDGYGNTTLTLTRVSDGTYLKIKWDSRTTLSTEAGAALTAVALGDVLNVETVLGWASSNALLFYTDTTVLSAGTLTDQAIADYELTKVTLPVTPQTASFTLDVAGLVGATIAWESNDAAIAIVGADATVIRPASGQADAVVTLTYTVTYGTATASSTIDVTVTAESAVPVEAVAYETTFEAAEGFAVTSVYNNTSPVLQGASGEEWSYIYGTTSTTGPIEGLQSAQMRWYASAPTTFGSVSTTFAVNDITKVEFYSKWYGYAMNVEVSYSTDGTTWVGAEVFTLTDTATMYTYIVNGTGTNYVRFSISLTETTPG